MRIGKISVLMFGFEQWIRSISGLAYGFCVVTEDDVSTKWEYDWG